MSHHHPRRVGTARTLEMMVICRRISGGEADRLELASSCIANAAFDTEVAALARTILASQRHSNAVNKQLVFDTDGMSLGQGITHKLFRSPGSQVRVAGACSPSA